VGKNNFYEPTVLINVDHTMKVMVDETFGPVVGVMKVKDDQEAVKLMGDTEYGLTASVYCQDTDRAKNILSQLDVGTSYINCCDRVSPYLPWAGRKHSGLGATLSYLGILAFAKPRGWHIRKA
jgi:acyl-CoA reductase-like NAD-dependent aldehyde dehydrogenase